MQPILTKGTEVKNLDIGVAKDNQKILIENQNDAMAFLPNGYNQDVQSFKYTFEELEAPVKKGTKVGNLNVYYKDYLLYQEEYVSDKNIERDEMKDMYNGIINFMFPYGLAIILVIAYVMISKIKKSRRVIQAIKMIVFFILALLCFLGIFNYLIQVFVIALNTC